MDEHLRDLKRQIKVTCKTKFITYCQAAGFSETDIALLVPFFYDGKTEDYIADKNNMSLSTYQKKKHVLLMRLISYKNHLVTL